MDECKPLVVGPYGALDPLASEVANPFDTPEAAAPHRQVKGRAGRGGTGEADELTSDPFSGAPVLNDTLGGGWGGDAGRGLHSSNFQLNLSRV